MRFLNVSVLSHRDTDEFVEPVGGGGRDQTDTS